MIPVRQSPNLSLLLHRLIALNGDKKLHHQAMNRARAIGLYLRLLLSYFPASRYLHITPLVPCQNLSTPSAPSYFRCTGQHC